MYIPADIRQAKQAFSKGSYLIHPKHANNAALVDWIKTLQFEQYETTTHQLQKYSRQRNLLYTFLLPCVNKEVILKVSENSKHEKWYRKLNLIVAAWFKDYSLNAYYGAIGLEKIGVDSLNVIAHWTSKDKNTKSYLLYEKVEASMSAYDLCNAVSQTHPQPEPIIDQITHTLAQTVRRIHQKNMRHGDPHAGNFLVTSAIEDITKLNTTETTQLSYTLIDLDKSEFICNGFSRLKKIYDLRCLRRFRVHDVEGIACLEYYLGKPPSSLQKMILCFWMGGGFNPYKWLKARGKRV